MSAAVPALQHACESLNRLWTGARIEREKLDAAKNAVACSIEGIADAKLALPGRT